MTEVHWWQSVINRGAKAIARRYPIARGRERLFNLLRKFVRGTVLCKDCHGVEYLLDLDGLIDAYIYLQGAYEPESIAFIVRESKAMNCDVFVDVGANIGVHTLALAREGLKEIWFITDFSGLSQGRISSQARIDTFR